MLKNKVILSLSALFLTGSLEAAVSFTNSRIFIDNKSTKQDFILFNRGNESETCNISLIDHTVDENGKLTPLPNGEQAPNSAQKFIRFTPKRIVISPQQTQRVKILARGFSKSEYNELHSYLNIACKLTEASQPQSSNNPSSNLKQARVIPTFVNRIPIIIRKDHSPVKIDFADVKVSEQDGFTTVDFGFTREGDRSVYGAFTLLDDDGKELAITRGVSSYIQSSKIYKQLKFKGSSSQALTLKFTEDPKFGGSESTSLSLN